jgi:hypothetical protein
MIINVAMIRIFGSRWVAPEYLHVKPKLRVLILGSYTASSLKRLEKLKKFLLENGYLQTRLIKDFEKPTKNRNESQSAFNLRKSEYWIPRADVPIFVFLPRVKNDGVGFELQYLCHNFSDMTWRSILGISRTSSLKISSLISGLIERWSDTIQQVFFTTNRQLQNEVRGALTNLLERLYQQAINREEGEWEIS